MRRRLRRGVYQWGIAGRGTARRIVATWTIGERRASFCCPAEARSRRSRWVFPTGRLQGLTKKSPTYPSRQHSTRQLEELSVHRRAVALGYRIRWQPGHKWLERFMNCSRTIRVPQRVHGCPASPYTFRLREKYPLLPATST